jgi:hypothetical protein
VPHKKPRPRIFPPQVHPPVPTSTPTEMSSTTVASYHMTPEFPFFLLPDTPPAEEDYTAVWSGFTNDAQPYIVQDTFLGNLVSVVSGISKGYSRFRVTGCPHGTYLWQWRCNIFQCRYRRSYFSPHLRHLSGGSFRRDASRKYITLYHRLRALAYIVALQDPSTSWLASTPRRFWVSFSHVLSCSPA